MSDIQLEHLGSESFFDFLGLVSIDECVEWVWVSAFPHGCVDAREGRLSFFCFSLRAGCVRRRVRVCVLREGCSAHT